MKTVSFLPLTLLVCPVGVCVVVSLFHPGSNVSSLFCFWREEKGERERERSLLANEATLRLGPLWLHVKANDLVATVCGRLDGKRRSAWKRKHQPAQEIKHFATEDGDGHNFRFFRGRISRRQCTQATAILGATDPENTPGITVPR